MTDFSQHIRQSLQAAAGLAAWVAAVGLVIWNFSGIYSVEPGEIAVHTRFGRILDDMVMPGIHAGFPYPFDEVFKVPVKKMKSMQIHDFSGDRLPGEEYHEFTILTGIPTYCLTGDNNIVTISCVGQFTIQSAGQYLFATSSPEDILQKVTSSALIHCLSRMSVDTILTTGKKDIADFVKAWVNRRLGAYDCGLQVQFLELKSVAPPALVQAHFRDVIRAGIDRKKMINDAESYESQRLAGANAEAESLRQRGLAYQTEMMAQASGLSERFLKRLSEFEKNPQLVRQKDYFDFFSILGNNVPNKIILNTAKGKAPVNLRLSWPK